MKTIAIQCAKPDAVTLKNTSNFVQLYCAEAECGVLAEYNLAGQETFC